MRLNELIVPQPSDVISAPNVVAIEEPRRWTRPPAEFVLDLSGYDIDHQNLLIPGPRESAGRYLSRYEDKLLFGYHHLHALIGEDGRFDCQDINGYSTRLRFHIKHHPGRDQPIPQISESEDGFSYSLEQVDLAAVETLPGGLFFGTPIEPLNWGMWLLHGIPNAVDFLRRRQEERFFCYVDRPWQMNLLRHIGLSDQQIVPHQLLRTYRCRALTMHQYSFVDLSPTELDRGVFEAIGTQCAPADASVGREKVFVARRNMTAASHGRYRALLNEDALIAALSERGFDIIEPELLPFETQVAIFRRAKIVVGLGGAGMFNVVFSRPGTRVVSIESSADFVHGHASLFAALNHRYGVIFGRQDLSDATIVHKRWTIDIARAVQAIESFV